MLRNISKIACLVFCFLFFAILTNAQDEKNEKPRVVEILRASSLEYDESTGVTAKRLLGDVVFRHEDAYMFCDSAWFFDDVNTIKLIIMLE